MARILLDIDDTVFIARKLHPRFSEFKRLAKLNGDSITVWSSNEDGEAIAALMGFNFLSKNKPQTPKADILIDDHGEQFSKLCCVVDIYTSLDDFLNENSSR